METLEMKIQALTEKVGGMESTEPGYDEAKAELDHLIAIRDHGEDGAKLREERAQVQTQLSEERQKGAERNQQRVTDLESQEAQLLKQIMDADGQAKQEQRVQKQTEQLDVLGQQIQDMNLLGAILPENQLQGTNVGLTEYGDMRQSLNQILHNWATGLIQDEHKVRNEEVAALQAELQGVKEELRASSERETQLKRQNDELQKDYIELAATQAAKAVEAQDWQNKLADANKIIETGTSANQQLVHENGTLRDHIAQLNRQLEEANKPKPTFTTTQSVHDQIEGLRKKSEESWAEKANRGLARWNNINLDAPAIEPVALLEVAQSGATFPENPTADHNGDSAEASTGVQQEVTFQEDQTTMAGKTSGAANGEVVQEAPVSRQEFEALKGRVAAIEQKPQVVYMSDQLA